MRKKLIPVLLLCMAFALPSVAQKWKREDFKALTAYSGTWYAKSTGGELLEWWVVKNDSLMENKSYYIKDKKETLSETVNLVYSNGKIQYIATAYGQNDDEPVAFNLISKKNKTYIFENKEHDFPQRIIYRFPAKNRMQVTINGTTAKGFKQVDFDFTKRNRSRFE